MLCGSWAEVEGGRRRPSLLLLAVAGGLISDSVREIEVDAAELLAPRLGLLPLRSFGGGSRAAQAAAHGLAGPQARKKRGR